MHLRQQTEYEGAMTARADVVPNQSFGESHSGGGWISLVRIIAAESTQICSRSQASVVRVVFGPQYAMRRSTPITGASALHFERRCGRWFG